MGAQRSGPEPLVVALDGPSGVGKSTTARRVADVLGLPYLDTGAMYRALGLRVLEGGVDPDDEDAVADLLERTDLQLELVDSSAQVLLDGEPVEGRIRSSDVGVVTSKIAAHPRVRRFLVALQRRMGRAHGGVLEGRDIGTVVFPETPFKFFLDASPEIRTRRRHRQLMEQGREVRRDAVQEELAERDRLDRQRRDSPLRHDDSYIVLDTDELDEDSVVAAIVDRVRADC
jgi:cytidylate kinase